MFAPLLGGTLISLLLLGVFGAILWWTLGDRQRLRIQTAALREVDPANILRERFARGEIDIATFEERMSHLLRAMQAPDESADDLRRYG